MHVRLAARSCVERELPAGGIRSLFFFLILAQFSLFSLGLPPPFGRSEPAHGGKGKRVEKTGRKMKRKKTALVPSGAETDTRASRDYSLPTFGRCFGGWVEQLGVSL